MADIDPNSETWKAAKEFLDKQRSEAVELLIAGEQCNKQRGRIELIDQIYGLEEARDIAIKPTTYC